VNQEDINYINSSITHNEIETAIKSSPKRKSPRPDRSSAEFYQNFKEEQIPLIQFILLKLFHKTEREGTLPKSFCEAGITLVQNWTRTHPKRVAQSPY
jgi:hypothetical protein